MTIKRHVRDRARIPSRLLRAGPLAAAITATAALALAGCGGSTTSTASTGGGSHSSAAAGGDGSRRLSGSQSFQASALKFARCMRSHGVPNFPDPTNGGELSLAGSGVDKSSPAFQSASKACGSLVPGGGGGAGQKSDLSPAQALSLAKCMRAHGVPNFPDPNPSGAMPPGSVNLSSPQVKTALQACQPSGPPPAP